MSELRFADVTEEALSRVLETMFFTPVVGPCESPSGEAALTASLSFTGNPSGKFTLSVSALAGREMATNFLGSEEDLEDDQVDQVVKELTNMVCGSMLSRVESETHFELGEPKMTDALPKAALCQTFELEDGTITVCLETQS